jgi:ATP-dependent DNA helicase RecG
MLKNELLEIIANGENSGVEFKRDDIRPEQLAKEVVAMLNFQGGRVLIGVEDNGEITGLQRQNTEEWVMNVIRDKIHPVILPFYEEIKIDENLFVAVLSFPQGDSKPYVLRHQDDEIIFIRIGSVSRKSTREQQMRLYETGGMLHTEALPVARTNSDSLDKARLENYYIDIIREPEIPYSDEEWQLRLSNSGFLVKPGGLCTVAGIVLFGKKPRQFLKQAGLRVFAFNSKKKEYKAEIDLILDAPLVGRWDYSKHGRQLIDTGLIENLLEHIRTFITVEPDYIDENFRRETIYLYPIEAIREIIINAMVHRDWTRFVDIEVGIYSDRLEIISPGSLQNSMTVEKMIAGQRFIRNPTIMEIMRDYRYVDHRGMGIRTKVIPQMKKNNNPDPVFEATEDYVKTILYK